MSVVQLIGSEYPLVRLLLLGVAIINIAFGLYVYRQKPGNLPNRVFAAFAGSIALWSIGLLLIRTASAPPVLDRLAYVGASLLILCLLALAKSFPPGATLRGQRDLAVLAALGAVFALLSFTPLVYRGSFFLNFLGLRCPASYPTRQPRAAVRVMNSLLRVERRSGREEVLVARKAVNLVLVAVGCLLSFAADFAAAEPYVAGFAGAAVTQDKDVETRLRLDGVSLLDGTFRDVEFETSVLFGGKVGYFFERSVLGGNAGLELEVSHFRPEASAGTVRFSGTALGQFVDAGIPIQKATIELTAVGLNVLYRVPLGTSADFPRGRVHPYVGVGAALLIADFSTRTTPLDVNVEVGDTDVQPAVQAIAGVKLFVTGSVALFTEYRFVQSATFTFQSRASGTRAGAPVTERATDRADLTSHQFVAGVAWHW